MAVDFLALHDTPLASLREQARSLGLPGHDTLRRPDLVFEIGRKLGEAENQTFGQGVLEVHAEGFGFLRSPADNFLPGADDIYVSQSQIRRFKLQTGDSVIGLVRPPKEGERYLALLRVESVNGEPPGAEPPPFDSLTAIYPDERIQMGLDPWMRALDLVAPLGLGQRGLLIAPGRTGRTDLLRSLAKLLSTDEDLKVTVLLIGERPEEIHEWRSETRVEVIATPFDEPAARHVQVADIVFERARRMVERGDDAFLIVDSLTRLLRYCLAEIPPTGKLVGGVDGAALHRMRRYLGAARALEEGGSLAVIGVIGGDAGNEMDKALLDDLRDAANWELVLSRELAERSVSPPIDLSRSGTRKEERMLEADELERRRLFRGSLTGDLFEDAQKLMSWLHKLPAGGGRDKASGA